MGYITEAWEKQKEEYAERYFEYIKRWKEEGSVRNSDTHGHAMECSYVLINLFGCTCAEVDLIEKYGYIPDDVCREISADVKNIIQNNVIDK